LGTVSISLIAHKITAAVEFRRAGGI